MVDGATLVIILVVRLITGAIAAAIASAKGRSEVGWFFGGFFLDLIGIIIVACLSNLKDERARQSHHERENRRLREQLRQERYKGEAFRQHTAARLDAHDQSLGVDTRGMHAALPQQAEAPLLEQRPAAIDELAQSLDQQAAPAQDTTVDAHDPYAVRPMANEYATNPQPGAAGQQPPTEESERQWHYEVNGQATGPISERRLLAMLKSGQLVGSTLVWTEDLGDWKAANQVRALHPYIQS